MFAKQQGRHHVNNPHSRRNGGFTILELMVTIVILAILLSLAMPSWVGFKQKRELSGFAEQITSYLNLAQSEAIKRNETVSFSWDSPGGHNKNWCMGASMFPQNTPCDCEETDDTQADYCSIDGVSYRWVQSDFANADYDFIHMNPNDSSFAFDPIRGIVVDIEDTESTDGDYLFYVHSDMKNEQNNKRLYELQIRMSLTGRATICTDDDRDRVVGGYAIC